MKTALFYILSLTFITAATWQNIQSSTETQTSLNIQYGSLERSVVEFNIDGFHLIPVQTPEGEMYLAHLEDGASLLEGGYPDMHKFARSLVIPDDKQMAIKVLSAKFTDYANMRHIRLISNLLYKFIIFKYFIHTPRFSKKFICIFNSLFSAFSFIKAFK